MPRSSAPTPDSWRAVKALFEQALDLPADQREAFIDAAPCDSATRAELRSLLGHYDTGSDTGSATGSDADNIDGTGPRGVLDTPARLAGLAAREGQRLGAWQIVRPLGAGGMGEVFEARRADGQYQGRAAIKLLKRGMDSSAVLRRFALERQALARLNHPNIASLLDAGLSHDGLPFFVMELVAGVTIDAAARGRSVEQRLALFLQLADAVAHAHRALLVHRDLKPGNVLVTEDGTVKLLDFGIAKALAPSGDGDGDDDGAADHGNDTTVGAVRPFTPNYASPEQVRGEPVTTATDIYSLGVLLYQLLTGVRPTGRKASTPAQAARSVLEETPSRPSSLTPDLALDPHWLATRKRLEGDLDNILLKALEKPIERRYASVDALAQDVRRYLDGYPVSARAPSAGYVAAKFVGRHRGGVALAGLALLAVLGGLAGTAWQARRAELALGTAQQRLTDIRTLSKDVLLRYGDAVTYLPGGLKIKEQLLTDTLGYLDRLLADGGGDPAFKGEIAMTYARLADIQVDDGLNSLQSDAQGARNAERAIALFVAAEPSAPQDPAFYMWWGRSYKSRAFALRADGDVDAALTQLGTATAMLERGLQRFPQDSDLRSELGSALFITGQMKDTLLIANQGRSDEALAAFDRAAEIYEALVRRPGGGSEAHADVFQLGSIEGARALVYLKRGDLERARRHGLAAVALREQALALQPGNLSLRAGLVVEASNLGGICLELGDTDGALNATGKAWLQLDGLQRDEPQNAAWAASRANTALHRGRALVAQGEALAALGVLKLSEDALLRRVAAPNAGPAQHSRLARTRIAQGAALWQLGRGSEAQAKAEAARMALQALADASPQDAGSWMWLGELAALQAAAEPAERALWRRTAHDAYARSAALKPLAGVHLATWTRLSGG